MPKRNDYITRDEYFMWIALLSSQRSKDPTRQVGSCIVSDEKKIIWIGYNWLPHWCSDEDFPWDKNDAFEESKYAYVCHAELNSILNSQKDLHNCILYTTLFPCNECTKAIIQSWIIQVVYLSDTHKYRATTIAAKRMLDHVWIKHRQVKINKEIILSYNPVPPHEHEKKWLLNEKVIN